MLHKIYKKNYELIFQSKLDEEIFSYDAVVYMKGEKNFPLCGFSARSIFILNKYNFVFHCENVLLDYDFENWLIKKNQWPIFPQIYLFTEFVGSYDILFQMDGSGALKELINKKKRNVLIA